MDRDICERLEEIIALRNGDMLPPDMIEQNGNWGEAIRGLLRDAKEEIESLRRVAGVARASGPSLRDIKQEIKNVSSL